MRIIGIDIGMEGAIAMLDQNRRAAVADLPIVEDDTGERSISGRGLLDIIHEYADVKEPTLIVAEALRPRPGGNGNRHGNTMASQGSIMQSKGIVRAAASIAGIRVHWVEPQAWKRHYGLINRESSSPNEVKERSRLMAIKLLPNMAPALARKKDHNRAEALLLARWGLNTQV